MDNPKPPPLLMLRLNVPIEGLAEHFADNPGDLVAVLGLMARGGDQERLDLADRIADALACLPNAGDVALWINDIADALL